MIPVGQLSVEKGCYPYVFHQKTETELVEENLFFLDISRVLTQNPDLMG